MRILLPALLLCFSAQLFGQSERVYRRGISVSISYDLERGKPVSYSLYFPEGTMEPQKQCYNATLVRGGDTLVYHPLEDRRYPSAKPADASVRQSVQLRLEKKFKSGFEFGGGLYYNKGWFDTTPAAFDTPAIDYAYYAGRIDYLTYGISGQLKFDFFRHRRLQPSIGLQSLLLNQRTRTSNQRAVFPAYAAEVSYDSTNRSASYNSFVVDLRVTAALTYVLTERVLLAANLHLLSATRHAIGGLQLKYRLTDY